MPTPEELLDRWRAVAERSAPGAAARGEDDAPPPEHAATPPWDLEAMARATARGTTAVLLLGPVDLEPDGYTVVRHDAKEPGELPYPDRCLDVAVVRRRPFDADELARVLRPGGVLLAEQVGGDDVVELHAVLASPLPRPHQRVDASAAELLDAGLRVTRQETWHGPVTFDDVASLVAYLTRDPAHAPADFSVDGYANTLLYLHLRGPAWGQPLAFTQSRFLLRAERPD